MKRFREVYVGLVLYFCVHVRRNVCVCERVFLCIYLYTTVCKGSRRNVWGRYRPVCNNSEVRPCSLRRTKKTNTTCRLLSIDVVRVDESEMEKRFPAGLVFEEG